MANITISDWLLIAATVTGPVLAVQAQKWVERATERRRQKRLIFATLMNVKEFPISQDAADLQAKLQERMLDALSGNAALSVTTKDEKALGS
jgi:hypothetical protein